MGEGDFMSLGKPFLFLTVVPQEKILLARRVLERLTNVKKLSKNTWKFVPTRLSVSLSTTPKGMLFADHVLSSCALQTCDKKNRDIVAK